MLRFLLLLLAAAAVTAPAAAHSHKKKGLEIVHPWTPELQKGAAAARVFMTIRNRSAGPDRLLSAATSRADKVQLQDAGKGAAAFTIQDGGDLDLYGDGPGLMLVGLNKPLHAYDDFRMTLVFEKAGPIAIDVMVEEAEAPEPETR